MAPFEPMSLGRRIKDWFISTRFDEEVIAYRQNQSITCGQMRRDIWALRNDLSSIRWQHVKRWALCFDDGYWFTVSFWALLSLRKTPILLNDIRASGLEKFKSHYDGIIADMDRNAPSGAIILHIEGFNKRDFVDYTVEQFEKRCYVDARTRVVLYTSGSTGEPKEVAKSVACLEAEVDLLVKQWGSLFKGLRVLATVSPHHQYGLTFRIMMPMALGVPFEAKPIQYFEQLMGIVKESKQSKFALITSPAFLKRLDLSFKLPFYPFILSAGGVLPFHVSEQVQEVFGQRPFDLYGSTETGVIAWRNNHQNIEGLWKAFDGVTLEWVDQMERWIARSSCISSPKGIALDDQLEFKDHCHFIIRGRYDRMVNIEDKKVSLTEVERCLSKFIEVLEVVALPMWLPHRQIIGVVIVLSKEGEKALQSYLRDGLTHKRKKEAYPQLWRKWSSFLKGSLDDVAVPRRWRFVDEIALNAQGKRDYTKLMELLQDVSR